MSAVEGDREGEGLACALDGEGEGGAGAVVVDDRVVGADVGGGLAVDGGDDVARPAVALLVPGGTNWTMTPPLAGALLVASRRLPGAPGVMLTVRGTVL